MRCLLVDKKCLLVDKLMGFSCQNVYMLTAVDAHSLLSRVTRTPGVRSGKPIIVGTRVTVWDILGWLAGGMSEAEILEDFPYLKKEDIQAAIAYVSNVSKAAMGED